ncbi:hypothetical protein KP509_23G075700 [Ceratopteris richardii]|nr:hypothetical protein KP509_23G075700 [Ceratopteris richardii]
MAISRERIYELLLGCAKTKHLEAGRKAQHYMALLGLDTVTVFNNHLIRIFASCQSLAEAYKTFQMVLSPTVRTWTAIISAYGELGRVEQVIKLYMKMQEAGIQPDKVVFLCVLKFCGCSYNSDFIRLVHYHSLEVDLDSDMAFRSALIAAYANFEHLEDAQRIFDRVSNADQVIWGAMIAGYANRNYGSAAFELFAKMQEQGICGNEFIYTSVFKSCGSMGEVRKGRKLHHLVIEAGVDSNIHVGSSVVDMYGKCGNLEDALKVFDKLHKRNIVSWGAMIGAYVQNDMGDRALAVFARMQNDHIKPDRLVYVYALRACEKSRTLTECLCIHDQIVRAGLNTDTLICHTLIEVYLVCGSLLDGNRLFDMSSQNVDAWNAWLAGYVGNYTFCMNDLFDKLLQSGIILNDLILLNLLKACGTAGSLEIGRQVHLSIIKYGFESDGLIISALIDMYAKGGSLVEAHVIFHEVACDDVVIWGSMMSAYSAQGFCACVCQLYEKMEAKSIAPDKVVFLALLKACGTTKLLNQGRIIHFQIIKFKLESDLTIGNSIVDMYAKCGSMDEALNVFHILPYQDEVSWSAITGGCVGHGYSSQARELLNVMMEHGQNPAGGFTNLLAACSHAGLIEEGLGFFKCMSNAGIAPDIEQYSCMVDLFCRKGKMKLAKDLLRTMPAIPDFVSLISLLTSCRTHGKPDLANQCFEHARMKVVPDLDIWWRLYTDTTDTKGDELINQRNIVVLHKCSL